MMHDQHEPIALTWATEQRNPRTADLDTLPTADVTARILAEDATVAAAVQAVATQIAAAVDLAVAAISAGGRVHYVGAGTSGRLGVLDAVELYPTYGVDDTVWTAHLAGGQTAMTRAVEGAEDDAAAGAAVADGCGCNDLLVGIAASGRTPFVRGALARGRDRGLPTVLISSNPQAPAAVDADVAILPDTGPEVVTGSTRMKAATAQKMILNAVSTATMVRLGKTYENLMINVVATNAKLERRVVHLLQQATRCPEAACAAVLAEAEGDLRTALVALLASTSTQRARDALDELPEDASRTGDPAGVRTAVQRITGSAG